MTMVGMGHGAAFVLVGGGKSAPAAVMSGQKVLLSMDLTCAPFSFWPPSLKRGKLASPH